MKTSFNFHSFAKMQFFYRNQFGENILEKPDHPTVHAAPLPEDVVCAPNQTPLSRAVSLGLLDRWEPRAIIIYRNGSIEKLSGLTAFQVYNDFNLWCQKTLS